MLPRLTVRPSTITGRGLFTLEPLRPGRIICLWPIGARLLTEDQYLAALAANDPLIGRTGARYAGRFFSYTDQDAPHDYFNHSFEPNCLVHLGVVLARRELPAESELTIDYRTFLDDGPEGTFADVATGREIRGLSARETALHTARELIALLESLPDWQG